MRRVLPSVNWQGANLLSSGMLCLLGLIFWHLPVPNGVTVQAWHLLAIFITTIFAVIVRPLPIGAIALVAMAVCLMTGTLDIGQALSSFSSPIIWLIVIAFLLARGFIKTGLGERIAYILISKFGHTTLGVTYALVFTELVLAPAIPSNTARGGGVIYPVARSLAETFHSHPQDDSRYKMGNYLMQVCYQNNLLTSVMFLTAMASNPLCASLASQFGVTIDWMTWAKGAIVPGLVGVIAMPLLMLLIAPPHIKHTPEAPTQAWAALQKKGPLSFNEKVLLVTFLLLLTLWIFGGLWGVDATTTAIIGVSILLVTGVLTWDDVLSEKEAWSTLIWFTTLLMMATMLTKFGMMDWIAIQVRSMTASLSWQVTLGILVAAFFYVHYFFANITSHVTSFYAPFLAVAIAAGAPPMPAAMMLAYYSCLSGALTHYGTGSAPVYFGAGYVTVQEWWRTGAYIGLFSVVLWATVGVAWWKLLGLW